MGTNLDYWESYFNSFKKDMLPGNYKLIVDHIRRLKAASRREQTIVNHYLMLTQFAVWCKVSFTALTEDDLLDYSEYLNKQVYTAQCRFKKPGKGKRYSAGTRYAKLAVLKAFLRELKVEAVTAITAKPAKGQKLPEDLLTKEEVEALINNAPTERDRALIATLYESGMRRGEMFSIKVKNVSFDENGAVILIPDGKTGPRRIRLVFSTTFLRQWLDVHPVKGDREAALFCSLREPFGALTDSGLRCQMKKIAKKAGIQKRVNAHSFRHARCTHLAEHLTESQMKSYLGWTEGSSMAAVYVHLSGKDIDNAILKMNGIQVDNTHAEGLKVGKCPRCHDINPESAKYCNKCGMPLKDEIRERIERDTTEMDLLLFKIASENPDFYKVLTDSIRETQNKKETDV